MTGHSDSHGVGAGSGADTGDEHSKLDRLLESFEDFRRDMRERLESFEDFRRDMGERLGRLEQAVGRIRAEQEYQSAEFGDLRRRLDRLELSVDELRRRRRIDEEFLDHVKLRGVPEPWDRERVPDLAGMVGSFTDDEVDAPRFND